MKAMEFQDVGRTFTCEAGSSPATPGTMWWWVSVSGEKERYAAFRVEDDDTPDSLKPRVVAYYERILADRERPRLTRPTWAQRKSSNTPASAPTSPTAEQPK